MKHVLLISGAASLAAMALVASAQTPVKRNISYAEAKPIVDALRETLPDELAAKTPAELASAWPRWVSQHNAAIRGRLERGDEDSIVYLWSYGTSFTQRPPVTDRDIARLGGAAAVGTALDGRMDDLIAGIVSPGTNERLQFARRVMERKGINPSTPAGKEEVRRQLVEARTRVLAEFEKYTRTLQDPNADLGTYSTLFHDRGLSTDTSVLPAFAIEQALETIKAQGVLTAGSVQRVAVVGPGLDFANKADGYDFYPQQTIQPFALIDSLTALGLARPAALRLTTLDLSPRVNQHIDAARMRARAGGAYLLHLPLDGEERWNPDLVAYWRRLGGAIATEVKPLTPPLGAGKIDVRALLVPPAAVLSITPQDLNIVLERLDPLPAGQRFDLIIATSILVYYDVFEQSLALANIASMLRPGGLFLTNTPVPPIASMQLSPTYATVVYSDRQRDFVFWYRRQ